MSKNYQMRYDMAGAKCHGRQATILYLAGPTAMRHATEEDANGACGGCHGGSR